MVNRLEYHGFVRQVLPTSLLVLTLAAGTSIFAASSQAQINGAPSSVTSPGFGGRAVNGPPASVTSLGPRGYAPNPQARFSAPVSGTHGRDGEHRRRHNNDYAGPYLYAVPVPYAVDNGPSDDYGDPAENDQQYQGGPTVFDRRGSGERSYVPPVSDVSAYPATGETANPAGDSEPSDPTLLVFKDGHKLEVGNYAIVGATLIDLSAGRTHKIPLRDLDLEATRKQNDDRGVIFQLPPSFQAN